MNKITRRLFLGGSLMPGAALIAATKGRGRGALLAEGESLQAPRPVGTSERLFEDFGSPEVIYAPVPLWWWDGDPITKERLGWQLDELHKKGVNQVCEINLSTLKSDPPYFSPAWWDLCEGVLREAEKKGMKVWFCDHIAWASNSIGNTVVAANPAYRGQLLAYVEAEASGPGPIEVSIPIGRQIIRVLGAFAYPFGRGAIDLDGKRDLSGALEHRTVRWQAPAGTWKVMIFYITPAGYEPEKDEIGFGLGYGMDMTNPDVGRAVIDASVAQYDKRFAELMGKTILGTFQDELVVTFGFPAISPLLLSEFQRKWGYDLVPSLGALYYEAGDATDKIRCQYFDVLVGAWERAWFKPFFDWHEKRRMLIGHDQAGRSTIIAQVGSYGDTFRTMRWTSAPGHDDPWEPIPERNFRDLKMSASIAHLYERPRVWCEALHTSGWGLNLDQQHYVYAGECVLGGNIYDMHGLDYTTHGSWYNWAPPSAHFRQPYWMHYRPFADYVTRLSFMQSQGKHICDVAVMYPVCTVQAHYRAAAKVQDSGLHWQGNGVADDQAYLTDAFYWESSRRIWENHIDFDYIDEDSLLRAELTGGKVMVAGESYFVLLLPGVLTLHRSTIKAIRQFYEKGGLLIAVGSLPANSVEGGRNDFEILSESQAIFGLDPRQVRSVTKEVSEHRHEDGGIAYFVRSDMDRVAELIRTNRRTDFSTDCPSLRHYHRHVEDTDFYLLYNASDEAIHPEMKFRLQGNPEIWDPDNGSRREAHQYGRADGFTTMRLGMAPQQALYVVFKPGPERPHAISSEIEEIESIETHQAGLSLRGWDSTPGQKSVRVEHSGKIYVKSAGVEALDPIPVVGAWDFSLQPTMDNRWGDFRLPAGPERIGPEVRVFRHREETPTDDGLGLGWHRDGFDDSSWEEAHYTYGPYWWMLGPIETRGGVHFFGTHFGPESRIDLSRPVRVKGKEYYWRKQVFSELYGIYQDPIYYKDHGSKNSVSPEFLDGGVGEGWAIFYLFTHVHVPDELDATVRYRGGMWKQLWVNGKLVVGNYFGGLGVPATVVHFKRGWNTILCKALDFTRPAGRQRFAINLTPLGTLAEQPQPGNSMSGHGPRLPGFREDQPFRFDIYPEGAKRVGWYRFPLCPGTRAIRLEIYGKARVFVAGEELPFHGGSVNVAGRAVEEGHVCALRIEQEIARYGGAAFKRPVGLEISGGNITQGCWTGKGLLAYSGGATYTKEVVIPASYSDHKLILDLGAVNASAEAWINGKSAGIRAWRPYHFDVTSLLRPGRNEIKVQVANTLANHYLTGSPDSFIYEGTEVSGLLGPVRIIPKTRVVMEWNL